MKPREYNRRKYPRAGVVVDAKVCYDREKKDFHVRTKNIGAGGICVSLPEMLPAGTELRMTLELPDADTSLEVTGEVVWTLPQRKLLRRKAAGFDTGIKFVEIDQRDRDRLIRLAQEYIF